MLSTWTLYYVLVPALNPSLGPPPPLSVSSLLPPLFLLPRIAARRSRLCKKLPLKLKLAQNSWGFLSSWSNLLGIPTDLYYSNIKPTMFLRTYDFNFIDMEHQHHHPQPTQYKQKAPSWLPGGGRRPPPPPPVRFLFVLGLLRMMMLMLHVYGIKIVGP